MAKIYKEFRKQVLELKNLYEKKFTPRVERYEELVETATKNVADIKQKGTLDDFVEKSEDLKKFEKELDLANFLDEMNKYFGPEVFTNTKMMSMHFRPAVGSKYYSEQAEEKKQKIEDEIKQAEEKKQEIENKIKEVENDIYEIENFLKSIES